MTLRLTVIARLKECKATNRQDVFTAIKTCEPYAELTG
jgi:hypothetical protein